MQTIESQGPAVNKQAEYAAQFEQSVQTLSSSDFVVIRPDEYVALASLSHEEEPDIPDGLYIVDETVRERLHQAGIDYDTLNSAVLTGVKGQALQEEQKGRIQLGRQTSAHHVFAGMIRLTGSPRSEGEDPNVLVMVKTHEENGERSAKPFSELGNLALLQSLGMEGIYRPVGVLKDGDYKFVLTELRPGVRTLDGHQWYGRGENFRKRRIRGEIKTKSEIDPETSSRLIDRDKELSNMVAELLGSLHAQGIFHGDAQMKNIGWTSLENASESASAIQKSEDLKGVKLTVVDLENTKIFERDQNGDFPPDYYDQLTDLAVKDIKQFYSSFPKPEKPSRIELSDHEPFVEAYLASFISQRQDVITGATADTSLIDRLKIKIIAAINKANGYSDEGSGATSSPDSRTADNSSRTRELTLAP